MGPSAPLRRAIRERGGERGATSLAHPAR